MPTKLMEKGLDILKREMPDQDFEEASLDELHKKLKVHKIDLPRGSLGRLRARLVREGGRVNGSDTGSHDRLSLLIDAVNKCGGLNAAKGILADIEKARSVRD